MEATETTNLTIARSVLRQGERLGRLEQFSGRMAEIGVANGDISMRDQWHSALYTIRDQIKTLRRVEGVPDIAFSEAVKRGQASGQEDFETLRVGMGLSYPDLRDW